MVRGVTVMDGNSCEFEYRITCNTDDAYPGPLARKVHVALLSILQRKNAFPLQNPIEFTWGELFRAMGCTASGEIQRKVKKAIRSIEGTRIRSTYALKNSEGRPMKSRERGFGLYEQYVFFDEVMPDKSIADKNFVWLADWYLNNLNSMYCTPLDYGLWQELDGQSNIASRLYEFFTFNFTGPWETFVIDYGKLCSFLPLTPNRHPSEAKRQFATAIDMLLKNNVLKQSEWKVGKRGQLQLESRRGPRLASLSKRASKAIDQIEATEIREIQRRTSPEDELVCRFNALMFGDDNYQPTSQDRSRARKVIAEHGIETAQATLTGVVELVQERFPTAKTFGATSRYWEEAVQLHKKQLRRHEKRRDELIEEHVDRQRQLENRDKRQDLQSQWDSLSHTKQESLRQAVLSTQPATITKYPKLLHRMCLQELAKQQ